MSTDGKRPSKAAQTGAPSDLRRLEDIPVPRRRVGEDEEVEVAHILWAQDVKDNVVLPREWENPDVMAYVKLGSNFLDARRTEALPSHRRVSKTIYCGRSRAAVYGLWRLRHEKWGTVKEPTEEGMNLPVLRDESKAVYVSSLAMFARDAKADRHPEDWLRYCMLPSPHHTLPFLDKGLAERHETQTTSSDKVGASIFRRVALSKVLS